MCRNQLIAVATLWRAQRRPWVSDLRPLPLQNGTLTMSLVTCFKITTEAVAAIEFPVSS